MTLERSARLGEKMASSSQSDVVCVLYGPTQASKSTTFRRLCGEKNLAGESVSVGDGTGESVTEATMLRRSEIGLLMDTPGINDSKMRFTNAEAGRKVAVEVYDQNVKRVKVIVVESLANDAIGLAKTFSDLYEAFGKSILKSVVVLATKADKCKGADRDRRLLAIKDIVQKHSGTDVVVVWQNEGYSNRYGYQTQLQELKAALERVPGCATRDIEDIEKRVKRRAMELAIEAPPLTEIRYEEEQVERTIQVPYDVDEWEEGDTEMGILLTGAAAGAGFIPMFGPALAAAGLAAAAAASRGRSVRRTRYRDETRMETITTPKKRRVARKWEEFLPQAREAITREVRERFMRT